MKIARAYSKMTTLEVARKMKRSQSWVTQVESGIRRIHADDLQKLMEIYGLDDTPLNKILLNYNTNRKH